MHKVTKNDSWAVANLQLFIMSQTAKKYKKYKKNIEKSNAERLFLKSCLRMKYHVLWHKMLLLFLFLCSAMPLMRELNRYLEFIALYGILLNCAHFFFLIWSFFPLSLLTMCIQCAHLLFIIAVQFFFFFLLLLLVVYCKRTGFSRLSRLLDCKLALYTPTIMCMQYINECL